MSLTRAANLFTSLYGNWQPMTLPQFLLEEQTKVPNATGELTQLFNTIQLVAKTISATIRKNELYKVSSRSPVFATGVNEDMKFIDIIINDLFINMLRSSHTTCLLISNGNQSAIEVDIEKQGKYVVCFKSLDDASNIECHTTVGSIIAVYKRTSPNVPNVTDALQPGRNLAAAGYVMYGSATIFVLSMGNGVHGFTLDPTIGEFVLMEPDLHIMQRGDIYRVNEGSMYQWEAAVAEYVESKKCYRQIGRPYRSQYVGSITADVHRTLKHGGIYIHPTTKDYPKGKLSLLYECNPMAFIVTQAGGLATDGRSPILDIVPETIHQRCQLFLGSREDVRDMLLCFKRHDKGSAQKVV